MLLPFPVDFTRSKFWWFFHPFKKNHSKMILRTVYQGMCKHEKVPYICPFRLYLMMYLVEVESHKLLGEGLGIGKWKLMELPSWVCTPYQ